MQEKGNKAQNKHNQEKRVGEAHKGRNKTTIKGQNPE